MKENEVLYSCGAKSYDEVVKCVTCGEELSREQKTDAATGEHTFVLTDGKLLCDCGTGYTGPWSNQFFYRDGVRVNNYVLVEHNGDYYYISDYHKYAVDKTVYMTAQLLEGTGFQPDYYYFDGEGKMNTAVKQGVENGYLYIDGEQQKAYQLVKYEGDYYFVGDYHKVTVGATVYLTAEFLTGTNFLPGYFDFDENGKMVIKNGAADDGYFYINGVKQTAYQLVKTADGDYYYISDYHKYAKGVKLYMTAKVLEGTGLQPGYYEFDADGKMIVVVKNGVVDGYLYINDVKQTAYQLVKFEDAYYFIGDYHKVVMGKKVYLTAQYLEEAELDLKPGYYEFDAEGKMILG